MEFGIISTNRMICDPIDWDYSRFKSIITRYSGNPALLPQEQPTTALQCGPLKVVPGVTIDTPAPAGFGYNKTYSPWAITENTLERAVVWQPISDLETVQQQACDALAELRYTRETAGITLENGAQIATDRESQSMLAGTYQSLTTGLMTDTDWKSANGWATVTQTELEPIATAVALHVRACFKAERALQTTINTAADADTLRALDLKTEFSTAYTAALSPEPTDSEPA